MQEENFVSQIREAGGRVFVVGGWVRDTLRQAVPKDKDYVICGLSAERFAQLFPEKQIVGQAFPVYLLSIDGTACEVALARKERKSGIGYRGFQVDTSASIRIEEDLGRRDTTMNSIAFELPQQRIIDPFHGQEDIRSGTIRAISAHFTDDPVRALRAARQSAEFSFRITDETLHYMNACRDELLLEPTERIFSELERALRSPRPSIFFRSLQAAALLMDVFPELHALIGKTQPAAFHPEGDAFEHTMHIVDAVAAVNFHTPARFAALAHDLGKGTTPLTMLPHHYDHEQRGLVELEKWNQRCPLPKRWLQLASFILREHMRAPRLSKSSKIVQLLLAIGQLPFPPEDILDILAADHGSLPDYLANYRVYQQLFQTISGHDAPSELKGAAIGQWIYQQRLKAYQRAQKA